MLVGRNGPSVRVNLSAGVAGRTSFPPTSNNRAELAALILALLGAERLLDQGTHLTRLVIWSDSEYVVQCATGAWRRRVNADLWECCQPHWERVQSRLQRGVELLWTRGHVGNRYNEEADQLAQKAAPEGLPTLRPSADDGPDYRIQLMDRTYVLSTRDIVIKQLRGEYKVRSSDLLSVYHQLMPLTHGWNARNSNGFARPSCDSASLAHCSHPKLPLP